MASLDLHEKANFTRLSRLLVDKGTEALRNTFDGIHSPANLSAVLSANKTFLLKLKPRVINDLQWDLLYPPSGNPPDSKIFDVTLLTVLFRNICGLPKTGWGAMPVDSDRSIQANIVRIRLFRNEVYAHVTSTQVDNATFECLWKKISEALVDLNILQKDIDELKTCPLGPREDECLGILQDWKLREEESLLMLEGLNNDVKSIKCSINHLTQICEENRDGMNQLRHQSASQEQNKSPPCTITHSGKDEDLLKKLAKHNFKGKIKNNRKSFHLGTREWLLNRVDDWFIGNEHEPRILLLTAGPGFGKTVFSARVCEDFKQNGKLAGCHFCDFSDSNLRNPMIMLESLASQMCDNVLGFEEKLLDQLKRHHEVQNLKDAFRIYLQNPLDELELAEPILIVIDGLDESAADNKNEIVNLIADHFQDLPEFIKVLVTSRPTISLTKLNDIEKICLENNDCDNELDLKRYLEATLPHLANRKADSFSYRPTALDDLVQKCEGSFLYAFHAQSELRKRNDSENMTFEHIIKFLPKDLNSLYRAYFQRLEAELKEVVSESVDVLKVLEMIVACKSHLPLNFVHRALGLAPNCRQTQSIISKVNETVSCLLYVSGDVVAVFHKSIVDWLLARDYNVHEYTVKVYKGEKSLWLMCEQIFKEIKSNVCSGHDINITNDVRYALVHGFQHLIACNMKNSFFWLVDVVIIHVLLTIFPQSDVDYRIIQSTLSLWEEFLHSACDINDEIRAKISWHILEINFLPNYVPGRRLPLLSDSHFYYLQSVLTHSPKGCFSDNERKVAESILSSVPKFVEYNFHEVKVLPLAVKRFASVSEIKAVGLSHDNTMAAFAQSNGIVFVVSVKNLLELYRFPTAYESVSCCTFAPDDSYILFGKMGTMLNLDRRKEIPFFYRNSERFLSCDFSPNGNRLITCNGSSTIKLWDVAKKRFLFKLHEEFPMNSCYFSNTGLFIIGEWNAHNFHRRVPNDWESDFSSLIEKWETGADVSRVNSWSSTSIYSHQGNSSSLSVVSKNPVSMPMGWKDPLSSSVVPKDPVSIPICSKDPLSSPVVPKDPVSLSIGSNDPVSLPDVPIEPASLTKGSKKLVSSPNGWKKFFSRSSSRNNLVSLPNGSEKSASSPSRWKKFFSRRVSSKDPVSLPNGSKKPVSSPHRCRKKFFSRSVSSKDYVPLPNGSEKSESSPSRWKKFISRLVSSKDPLSSPIGSKVPVSSSIDSKDDLSSPIASKNSVSLFIDSEGSSSLSAVLIKDLVSPSIISHDDLSHDGISYDGISFLHRLWETDDNKLFCVWNAITLHRSDDRTLFNPSSQDAFKNKLCKRCFRPRFQEHSSYTSLEMEAHIVSESLDLSCISWSRGTCSGMQCLFALDEQSLTVIENNHFTTHTVWNLNFDVPYNLYNRPPSFKKITVIQEDMFLYADVEKLVVFRTIAPSPEQHAFLPHSTRVLWTCFSPNGCRLSTCNSDGYINIWNVEKKQVEQRFKSRLADSPFACWWSTEFLFVLFGCSGQPPRLSKYPVDASLEIMFLPDQRVLLDKLVEEVISLTAVTDFTEGFLVLECTETKSVKLVNIDAVGGRQLVPLPEIQPEMSITVSPGGRFVFGGCALKYYIWKKNIYEGYEVFFCSESSTHYMTTNECCFSSDSKVAVVFTRSRVKFEIVDLNTGNHYIVPFDRSIRSPKLFCLYDERIVIAASRQFLQFFDMETGALLESSYQRYLTKDFVMQTKLSPNDATLAFPNINGGMEFLRLCIPPYTILSNIKEKAAVEWEDARKEFNL